ncbi:MAG: carboxypeptidase regulatory-like domain-containing protein [Thermoanaerobaculia bacterium]|nr:carboxypeptidase regulatory-like domain-containing protein [Thermoanaerobaculia bacterium]
MRRTNVVGAVVVFVVSALAGLTLQAQQKVTRSPQPPPAGALPLSLADPDGQGLTIELLTVRAAISGPLSLTEIEIIFRNPQRRRIEGRFDIALPATAAISRFAKEVNGRLMEGEVVERLRANQVYEQFLHQMRDPALLEQDQGNRFSARIFPIDPEAEVRILLSYSELLPAVGGRRSWSFPIRGLRDVGRLSFRATLAPLPGEGNAESSSGIKGVRREQVQTTDVVSLDERDYTPERDLEISWDVPATAPVAIARSERFYIASIRVPDAGAIPAAPHPMVVYVDTSASAAVSSAHRIEAIEALLSSLPREQELEVVAFDNGVRALARGTADSVAREIGKLLAARLFLGGTDLGLVLDDIAERSKVSSGTQFVLVTDGVATLGDTGDVSLLGRARGSSSRIDAVVIGQRQSQLLRQLTTGRGRVIPIPLSESFLEAARRAAADLRAPLGAVLTVADEAAEWVFPSTLHDVRPGTEVFILAKLASGRQPRLTVRDAQAEIASAKPSLLTSTGFDLLLEREAWRAYLDYLKTREVGERDAAIRNAIARERVSISMQQRVLIPETTLLVLESEEDYQRFNIDRRALTSILSIGASGVEKLARAGERAPSPAPVSEVEMARADLELTGVVRGASGPVAGAQIRVSGTPISGSREAVSAADGSYRIDNLPSGDYTVRFEAASAGLRFERITLRRGDANRLDALLSSRRTVVPPARPDGTISGTVHHEGQPLPGATLRISGEPFTTTVVSDVNGRYRAAVPPGNYVIFGEMSGMNSSSKQAVVRPEQNTTVDFTLQISAVAEMITVGAASLPDGERPGDVAGSAGLVDGAVLDEEIGDGLSRDAVEESVAGVDAPPPPGGVAEAITVTAAAPSVLETTQIQTTIQGPASRAPGRSAAVAPDPPEEVDWIRGRVVDSGERKKLEERIRRNPSERPDYTSLSELLFALGEWRALRKLAIQWQPYDPENPQVYEMLGEAESALGNGEQARRAFASIIEVAASRPELLQRAGLLLLRAGGAELAEAPLVKAVEMRPDRVNPHRNLALLYWKQKKYEAAASVLESAMTRRFAQWYGDVHTVLSEELGYVYRSWIAAEPKASGAIAQRARERGVDLEHRDALRITMAWETDANDVDLHVVGPKGDHCFYSKPATSSGLTLYGDVTQGLGPEVVRTDKLTAGTYSIGVNYFASGPMGVSRGLVVILRSEGLNAEPQLDIVPFRLVEGNQGGDVRLIASVKVAKR